MKNLILTLAIVAISVLAYGQIGRKIHWSYKDNTKGIDIYEPMRWGDILFIGSGLKPVLYNGAYVRGQLPYRGRLLILDAESEKVLRQVFSEPLVVERRVK